MKTARSYRTIQIQADHVITAADPLPGELRQAIEVINSSRWLALVWPKSGHLGAELGGGWLGHDGVLVDCGGVAAGWRRHMLRGVRGRAG